MILWKFVIRRVCWRSVTIIVEEFVEMKLWWSSISKLLWWSCDEVFDEMLSKFCNEELDE